MGAPTTNKQEETKMPSEKLFQVTTIAPVFHGHRDVDLSWFVDKRPAPMNRPYRELIEPYLRREDWDTGLAEEAIDEMLSAEEAEALAAWLRKHRPQYGEPKITEAELPIGPNTMGVSGIPLGGGQDVLLTGEAPDYDLPFKVGGYYDLRHYERIEPEEVDAR
jgi:hypothetical protein